MLLNDCSTIAWKDSIRAMSLLVATDNVALVTITGTGVFGFEHILPILFELINNSHCYQLLVYDGHGASKKSLVAAARINSF